MPKLSLLFASTCSIALMGNVLAAGAAPEIGTMAVSAPLYAAAAPASAAIYSAPATTSADNVSPANTLAPAVGQPAVSGGSLLPTVTAGVLPHAPAEPSAFAAVPATTAASAVIERLAPEPAPISDVDALTRERARIRLVGDYEAMFRGAAVGDVVRALAEHAQMRYIAPSGDALGAPVSISGTYNLLDLLDLLHDHYGMAMIYERNIWRFSKATPDALIMKTYILRNNNREDVDITSPVINSIGNNNNNGYGSNGGVNGSTGSPGGGSSTAGSSSNASFKVSYDALTKDIDDLLAIPAPTGDGEMATKAAAGAASGKVKYIPETNELMVVASQYHQDLVREYLDHVDQPLEQIEFSAYFVETSRDPQRELGLDWSNAVNVALAGSSNQELNNWTLPHASILTQYQLAAVLKLTAQDSESAVVQNPSVVGLPNRKTVLDATRQIPVAQSTFNAGGNVTASTSTSLQYLDVGTIVNIYPIVRKNERGERIIRLHVSLVVSSLIGETLISGNPAPLTARRRFEFSAEVPEGQTLSIGGLVSSTSNRVSSKVPFLSAIPVAGRLFRSDSDTASRSNMLVYITPRVLRPGDNALRSDLPRVWPEDLKFTRPIFIKETGTPAGLQLSLGGFGRELAAIRAFMDQRRDPAEIAGRLAGLREELGAMNEFSRVSARSRQPLAAADLEALHKLTDEAAALHRALVLSMRI